MKSKLTASQLAKNLDYTQNSLAAAHHCALGANRRCKLALTLSSVTVRVVIRNASIACSRTGRNDGSKA
jgi:hypothetical protein